MFLKLGLNNEKFIHINILKKLSVPLLCQDERQRTLDKYLINDK
jgi:hypothetical protein